MVINSPVNSMEIGHDSTVTINGPVKSLKIGYNCKVYTQQGPSPKYVSKLKDNIKELQRTIRELQKQIITSQEYQREMNDMQEYIDELKKVNHSQAKRIQKLEAHEPSPFMHPVYEPTKKDCETVLRMFKIYLDCEEV